MYKLLLPLTAVVCLIYSCQFRERIKGNGNIKTAEHHVSSFKKVEVSGAIDLQVTQGDTKPVTIETDENILQYIQVIQEGNKIIIKTQNGKNINPSGKIKVFISSPLYSTISVSGASNINGQNKITNAESLKMSVSGAGDINMDVNAPSITADVSGAGNVNLKGETKIFTLGMSGAGTAHCFNLLSEDTRVNISGAANADVYASVALDALVSGAGNVGYKGEVTNIKQRVSGAGNVKKVN